MIITIIIMMILLLNIDRVVEDWTVLKVFLFKI